MKESVKNAWIEALRSGKYKQGRGQLRDFDNSYCCLGVLCDIVQEELGLQWELVGRGNDPFYRISDKTTILPDEVLLYVHRDDEVVYFPQEVLVDLNDTQKYSFLTIADWIEKNL